MCHGKQTLIGARDEALLRQSSLLKSGARSVLYEVCEARYAPMKNGSGRGLATPVVPVMQSEHKHEAASFLIEGAESTKERV
jgi:hypothetical protein